MTEDIDRFASDRNARLSKMAACGPEWWKRKNIDGWMYEHAQPEDVHIVSAAIQINRVGYLPIVLPAARHFSPLMRQWQQFLAIETFLKTEDFLKAEQGFIDQYERFWTREQAAEIVTFTRQKHLPLRGNRLFSGDLY